MDDVEAQVARAGDPADRVQVGAVVVHERPGLVEDPGDVLDASSKSPSVEGLVSISPARLRPDLATQLLEVDVAPRDRW